MATVRCAKDSISFPHSDVTPPMGRRGGAEWPGTPFLLHAIRIAFDIDRRRVMEQPIQDRSRSPDPRIPAACRRDVLERKVLPLSRPLSVGTRARARRRASPARVSFRLDQSSLEQTAIHGHGRSRYVYPSAVGGTPGTTALPRADAPLHSSRAASLQSIAHWSCANRLKSSRRR